MGHSNRKKSAFERLLAGDVQALARAISLLEAGDKQSDLLANRLREHAGQARIIGITGPPGAGKSTLINAYVDLLRKQGERVAILAVDPSSPLSGGAVLGDRTRMGKHSIDPDVFIRSIAARGHLGGLSLAIPAILDAVDAAGWPTIILETVGAGQSETEVVEFADIKVVLNAPGLGDDVQAIKAGILEIADILVVNKGDLPLADRTVSQLKAMLELRSADWQNVPVIMTSAIKNDGLQELETAVSEKFKGLAQITVEERLGRRLNGLMRRRAETLFQDRLKKLASSEINTLCDQVQSGSLSLETAALKLADLALKTQN